MYSFLQTKIWADFKSRHGWTAHQLELAGTDRPIFVLGRPLPLGQSLLYAPEVTLPSTDQSTIRQLVDEAKKLDNSAFFTRIELFEQLGDPASGQQSTVAALTNAGGIKSFEEVQPEHRQWVNIGGDPATILASMKEKGRYNVRLAQRKGVITRVSTNTSDVEVFYRLFQLTAARDGFRIRAIEYFNDLCQTLFDHKMGELVIAEFEGLPLVALLITHYDGLAGYLYGASSNEKRNLMAPYAAHMAAIESAKTHGCTTYDLLQIAPPNAPENHHYANLTRFKEQFGGTRVQLVGGWDFVRQPLWYNLFKMAERIRRH